MCEARGPGSGLAAGRPLQGSGGGVRAASRGGGAGRLQTDAAGRADAGLRRGRECAPEGTRPESDAGSDASPEEAANSQPQRGKGGGAGGGRRRRVLPLPRLPVSALGRGRFVGFGLSGSRSASETAGDPAAAAAVGVRLGHARCRCLSPSIPSNMKDSGDSKDQQLMVRPHHPSFSTPSVAQTPSWP